MSGARATERSGRIGAEDAPAPGRRVGRYQLCLELASGGMGTVYLARAEGPRGFEKIVALKCIHPHLAGQQSFVDMFLDEARIAGRIAHPNVCHVFDFGFADGVYYIAMEYIFGEPLIRVIRRAVKRGARSEAAISARIIADACEGLHAAHELRGDDGGLLGVVHRDVSPQNLFVGYDGTVRVVDFGIARAAGQIHETRTGELKGKLAYMAPEQLRRLPLDRRTDVWALGVVLWESLTRRRLFRRESEVDTLVAITGDPIPPPSQVSRDVAPELDAIVLRALARRREERYASARELGRDLHRFVSAQPEPIYSADIAEWMEVLFAEERARRLELLEQARASRSEEIPRVSAALHHESSSQDGEEAISSSHVHARIPDPSPSPRAQLQPRHLAGIAAMLGAGLLCLGTATAFGVAMLVRQASPPQVAGPIVIERPEQPERVAADLPALDPPVAPPSPLAEHPDTPPSPQAVDESGGSDDESGGRRRVRPTPPESGWLAIVTPGSWAEVFVDGRRAGRTPLRIGLRPGSHSVELRLADGQRRITRRVAIVSGETTPLSVPVDR